MQLFSQSPTDPDFVQSPYEAYDRARGLGDVVFWEDYAMPAAVSHKAVKEVMTNRNFGRTPPPDHAPTIQKHFQTWAGIEAHSMLELEPPRHTRLRRLVLKAFTSRQIAGLEPFIEATARELLQSFPTTDFDFLQAFGQPLPVRVIAKMLGISEGHCDDLLRWSNAMVAMYQTGRTRQIEDAAEQASKDFCTFLADVIAHKERKPQDDLLSKLIDARDDGDRLSQEELISTTILLLNAGHEATVHSLGNGVLALDTAGKTDISDATVDEILRIDPPLHMFTRWAAQETEVCGVIIPAKTEIACVLGAANRDPLVFDAPECFNDRRFEKVNPHLSFGAGIHFCVGAPLARMEIAIALKLLHQTHPNLRVAAAPKYGNTYHFHGLEKLMVRT